MSDFFCPLPWNTVYISSIGMQTICCRTESIKLKNTYDFNHDQIRHVRLDILNNKIPEACSYCKLVEDDHGISSLRQHSINNNPNIDRSFVSNITDNNGNVSTTPTQYNLVFGNICNLKCMMCMPWCSSRWIEDWDTITNKQDRVLYDPMYMRDKLNLNWYKDETYFNKIVEAINTGDERKGIFCSGGEVLINPWFKTFLEKISNKNNIYLEILSNGTVMTEPMEKLLRTIPNLIMNYSIDAIGIRNDYIRFGSRFEDIEKNTNKMKDILGQIFITVSSVNILNIDEIIQWCEDRGYRTHFEIVYGPLRYLCPLTLPDKFRLYAIEKLSKYLDGVNLKYTKKEDVENLISMLRNKVSVETISIRDFLDLIQKFDRTRKTKFIKAFPDWKKALHEL